MLEANAVRALIVLKEQLLARRDEIERQIAEIDRQVKSMVDAALEMKQVTPVARDPLPPTLVPNPPPFVAAPPPVLSPEPAIDVDDPESFPTFVQYLIAQIRKGGGVIDLDGCAQRLYGSYSEKNRNRVSRILSYMVKRALIKHAGKPRTFYILEPT